MDAIITIEPLLELGAVDDCFACLSICLAASCAVKNVPAMLMSKQRFTLAGGRSKNGWSGQTPAAVILFFFS